MIEMMVIHWLKCRSGENTLQQHSVTQNATLDSDIVHGVVHHPAQGGAHGVVHHPGQGPVHGGAGGGGLQQGVIQHQGEWNEWTKLRNVLVTWKYFKNNFRIFSLIFIIEKRIFFLLLLRKVQKGTVKWNIIQNYVNCF